jgi:pimeloyl-ACP methyl ester carboxylesterase
MPGDHVLFGLVDRDRDRDLPRSVIVSNDGVGAHKPPASQEGATMPQVEVDRLTINYDVQGEGEPLLLIPYTSADHACFAFQLPAYTEHFSCIAIDLPGSGESDKPVGPYSTDGYAHQVAAFLDAIEVERAHVAGVSLGAAVGIHLAARHPAACARSRCTAAGTKAMTT